MNQKLTFEAHINVTVAKANRAFGLLIRTLQSASQRCSFNKRSALAAFNANVRPILEYCSVIWAGAAKTHLVRVERVQHKFLMWLASHTEPVRLSSTISCLCFMMYDLCVPGVYRVM